MVCLKEVVLELVGGDEMSSRSRDPVGRCEAEMFDWTVERCVGSTVVVGNTFVDCDD